MQENATVTFLGKSLNDWIQAAANVDENIRACAAWALSTFGSQAVAVVRVLIEPLTDDDSNVRSAATTSLAHLAPGAMDVLHALITALQNEEYQLRRAVIGALVVSGKAGKSRKGRQVLFTS
jgi:HEAT repeat protein